MKQTGKTEFRVGITVVTALLLLLWIIAWAKNVSFFDKEKILQVSFDSVAGLESGDMVSVNGVRKGRIESIELKENRVLVTAKLDEDTDIRKDAEFSIMMLDLMGGKKLEINPGNSQQQLELGAIHTGKFLGDISTAMAMLSGVENDLKTIIHELRITLNSVNNIITDEKFTEDVKTSFVKLNKLADQASVLISENRSGIKALLDSSHSLVVSTNRFLAGNEENISASIQNTKTFLESSNSLVVKLDTLLAEMSGRRNNLGKLLYDDEMLTNLKESLEDLKKITKILIEQLENEGLNVDANVDLF